ncbi:hypothetical protein ACSHWG_02165 [Leucobacter sp. Z1108]|uniref:hypothetical protein n=1 Tax=Leucobacter sp. Z1108 TaxID=3439066 RepID=UPI003F3A8F24
MSGLRAESQKQRHRARARHALSLIAAISVVLLGFVAAPAAEASVASGFDAGNIISDDLFYSGSAMGAVEVQAFLNGKVPRCTIGDTGRTPGTQWGSTQIAQVCLKGFKTTTSSRAANAYCSAYSGATLETAAEIIAKVGRSCGISQRVLLVMLEKEQSLISDSWPTVRQFDQAMGYACPDSGPNNSANCDPTQTGFFQQVYRAAWQLKVYQSNPNSYNYKPFQVNTIQWHPNAGCGTSQVYIQNWATAALYIYTPYRPNAAALNAGWGVGDTCSSYGNRNFYLLYKAWFGTTNDAPASPDPKGAVQASIAGPSQVSVSGWAFDPDTQDPVSVHVYVGGEYGLGGRWGGSFVANLENAAFSAANSTHGANHGFEFTATGLNGPTEICVYVINVGAGVNSLIGCPVMSPSTGTPFGNYEGLSLSGLTATVQAWTIDPDDSGPVTIHAYLGGPVGVGRWGGQYSANVPREDIGRAYPLYGSSHGLVADIPVGVGTTPICLYAMDRQISGASAFLGCKTVSTASGPPFGNVDSVQAVPGSVRFSGWMIDPDTTEPVTIHVYIDGRWGGEYRANLERRDVGRAYAGYGDSHGFDIDLTSRIGAGSSTVCIYGINSGAGFNSLITCRTIQLPGGMPFGNWESTSVEGESASLLGWMLDPDTVSPVALHAYVNGRWGGAYLADSQRPDVGRTYPGYGDAHGFKISVPIPAGRSEICVYGINVGAGATNPLIGCRVVDR